MVEVLSWNVCKDNKMVYMYKQEIHIYFDDWVVLDQVNTEKKHFQMRNTGEYRAHFQ